MTTERLKKGSSNIPTAQKRRPCIHLGRRDFRAIEVSIDKIDTSKNIRTEEDAEHLQHVKNSIAMVGVLNPILVMKNYAGAEKEYRCIAGHTRICALLELGYPSAPCTILPESDLTFARYYATIDNLVRNDLNPIDKANAFTLIKKDLKLSTTELARKMGCSRQYATCILNIGRWPDDVKDQCIKNGYSLKALFQIARKKMTDDEARIKVSKLAKPESTSNTNSIPRNVQEFCSATDIDSSMLKLLSQLERTILKIEAKGRNVAQNFFHARKASGEKTP